MPRADQAYAVTPSAPRDSRRKPWALAGWVVAVIAVIWLIQAMGNLRPLMVIIVLAIVYIYLRVTKDRRKVAVEKRFAGTHRCRYLGGAGLNFDRDATYRFGIEADSLIFLTVDGKPVLRVPFGEVIEAAAHGAGQVQKGGGFIGGGFGAQGAAEGMLLAGALNALTTKTEVHSNLRLVLRGGEAHFAMIRTLPADLDLALAPMRVAQRHAQIAAGPSAPPQQVPSQSADHTTTLQNLERLARLRDTGVLNEEEFRLQKGLLLQGHQSM